MQLSKALLCQVLAFLVIGLLKGWMEAGNVHWLPDGYKVTSVGLMIFIQPIIAAISSRGLGQPPWWQIIHLLFFPAILGLLSFHIPAWLYLLLFSLLLLVFWGTVKGDVPLFLSSDEVTHSLIEIIKKHHFKKMIELGAGVGTVVVPLAKQMPELQITALEHAPLPWLILRWRCRRLSNVRVFNSSFWDYDLSGFDLAYAFLSPLVMTRLYKKALSEMPNKSCLISSSFEVPDRSADQIVQLVDKRKTHLFCYGLLRK